MNVCKFIAEVRNIYTSYTILLDPTCITPGFYLYISNKPPFNLDAEILLGSQA